MDSIEGKMTPLGTLVTRVTDDGHVMVAMRASEGVTLMNSVASCDGEVTVDLWAGTRVPKPGDEVMVNGSSVEVVSVETRGGEVWVRGDNGQWARWSR